MPIIGVGEEGDCAARGLPTRRGVPTAADLALDAAGAVPTSRASRGQRHRSSRARVLPDRAPITTFRMWRWWSGWSGTGSSSARASDMYPDTEGGMRATTGARSSCSMTWVSVRRRAFLEPVAAGRSSRRRIVFWATTSTTGWIWTSAPG